MENETRQNRVVYVYPQLLNEDGYGDFVMCTDCEKLMLTKIGGTDCIECGSENLQWADEEHQECSIEELRQLGYLIASVRLSLGALSRCW